MKKRSERFVLGSSGCIKAGAKELFFNVKNMSTTGLLIEVKDNYQIKSENEFDMFVGGKNCDINFHVFNPDVSGVAKVVDVALAKGRLIISLKFSVINFEDGFMVFKRRLPRKETQVQGQLYCHKQWYSFISDDISLNGLSVKIDVPCPVSEGERVTFEVPTLSFCGSARVKWSAPEDCRLGVEYINLTHN
ncbi:MAG: PilZ domain-containing protein [Methylococcales bacterium]|jgi:hypothetical protein|nr:PilZ domain-containing protein [Methylococcales bacterium]